MNILIATDAWHPQVNGVVRTLDHVAHELKALGHTVDFITPQGRRTLPLVGYQEIRLAFVPLDEIGQRVRRIRPDAIHIATEGPIGWQTRRWCLKNGYHFTTSYHTRFPEYLAARLLFPGVLSAAYRLIRRFHAPSSSVLAPTAAVTRDLEKHGFSNVKTWTRGVDHDVFYPRPRKSARDPENPVLMHVGRLSVEKNVEAFLAAEVPGQKIVIGDGPARKQLEARYPDAQFLGYQFGDALAEAISQGDVFVFPSKTDTFGLVMLEAMACGLPVAAYPVTGPIDVVEDGVSGALNNDLSQAIETALQIDPAQAIAHAARYTWRETAKQFLDHLVQREQ